MSTTALLIPCYQAERYLPDLRKQIDQLDPTFDEILLVDDGSDDNTFQLAQELGFNIFRLEKNLGPGAARNFLVKKTSAEWIHFHDVDDEIDPRYLQETIPYLKEDTDVVLCSAEFVNHKSRRLEKKWDFPAAEFAKDPVTASFVNHIIVLCSTIRRERFNEIGGFDEELRCWEDVDIHFRLAIAGAKFVAHQKVLTRSPRHHNGISANHLNCHRCRLKFIERYLKLETKIPDSMFAQELRTLAYSLLRKGALLDCRRALALAEELGLEAAVSKNTFIRPILNTLSVKNGHLIQISVRIFSPGRLFKNWRGAWKRRQYIKRERKAYAKMS